MVTSDLGRVTTTLNHMPELSRQIVVTSDLGRVTTQAQKRAHKRLNCGDVRSRTSYNTALALVEPVLGIVVTSDLGRVTTVYGLQPPYPQNCGDVRSRTSYNNHRRFRLRTELDCGDVRSRTSYNHHFSSTVKEEEL